MKHKPALLFTILFSIFYFLFSPIVKAQVFTELHSYKLFADSLTNYSSIWIDADQDYDLDLLNFSVLNKPTSYHQNNNNTLERTKSIFEKDGGNANGACYADIDMDGDLDIFVYSIFGQKNYLYIQESKGLFRKELSLEITQQENNAFYATFTDVNLDNYPDLLITDTELWNPKTIKKQSKIYYNDGRGNFGKSKMQAFQVPNSDTRGILLADFNQDAREDLLLLNFGSANELYLKNEANLLIKVSSVFTKEAGDYVDGKVMDMDNDGDLDLFLLNLKTGIDVYKNNGNMNFEKVPYVFTLGNFIPSGLEIIDYNKDGLLDVLVHKSFSKEKNLFINEWKSNNYIHLKLFANKANKQAIGAKVYVKTISNNNSYWQYREQRANKQSHAIDLYDIHVGLGNKEQADSIKIIWPDGTEQVLTGLQSNASYYIEQREQAKKLQSATATEFIPRVKDLSVQVFADNFKYGDIAGITVFYENKGLIEQDVEVKINLSAPMKLFNSFPMPNEYSTTEFVWKIKKVPAQFRGIITLSVRTPNIEETNTTEQQIQVSLEPVIGDEESGNNEVVLKKRISN